MTPTPEQLLSLHTSIDRDVPASHIDENGHMNITHYFAEGGWAVWEMMSARVMGEDYIGSRGLSFFTVEHHIRYTGELREGRRYSVHAGLAGHAGKAAHAAAFVVDRERDSVACTMEVMFVHVDMGERRAVPVPDDIAAALEREASAHPWLADAATGLSLRR